MVKIVGLLTLLSLLLACSPQGGYYFRGNLDLEFRSNLTGNLADILHEQRLDAEYALLITSDGMAVLLTERSFSLLHIEAAGKRFNTGSDLLPPVCNLKDLNEIYLYLPGYPLKDNHTPFSLRMKDFAFLGESGTNGHYVRKYRLKETGNY